MWLEEPLHPDDLAGYVQLTSTVDIRIAAGVDVVQATFTTDINVAASLQFLCAIPNALVLGVLGVDVTLDAVAQYIQRP